MKKITLILTLFMSSIVFAQYDITNSIGSCFTDISSTGLPTNVSDDGEVNIIAPFTIYLGNVASDILRTRNNGAILFDRTTGGVLADNTNLSTSVPMIAPYWDDFDDEYGNVYFQTFGSAPNRYFIIQWNRVHFDGSVNTDPASFQVVFNEFDRDIRFAYDDVDLDGALWDNGLSATIGIATASEVTQYSFNTTSVNNNTCLIFSPKQTYVPDDNFEAYLETHDANGNIVTLGNPNAMGNGIANDNYVWVSSIENVTNLDVHFLNITNLTGIESFTALIELNCSDNSLNNLDIRNNIALTTLICYYTSISSLDVSNNTVLESLQCQGNQLINLDLSTNSNLKQLHCHDNNLSSLNISSNLALKELVCEVNPLGSLDLSANPKLILLDCAYTQLTNLDLSANPLLNILNCYSNQLISLDLSNIPNMHDFTCYKNQLVSLNIANGNNADLGTMLAYDNPNLTCIQVDNATNTPPAGQNWQKDATASYSDNCSTTYVPDNNFEAYLEANGIGNGILNDNYVLTSNINTETVLDIQNLNIADLTGIEDFTALTDLLCQDNSLSSLDVSSNTALTGLSCNNNSLNSLNVNKNFNLTLLSCYSNSLSSLDISNNTALEYLYCSENPLSSIDVSNNLALQHLSFGSTSISSLDISANTALTFLRCRNSLLTNLDISHNPALKTLICFDNLLSSLDVSHNPVLEYLSCYSNNISNLDVSNLSSLKTLLCGANPLHNLNLSTNNALEELQCIENALTDLDLSNNMALTNLWCQNNQLTNLNLTNNTALTNLLCFDNQLISLNIANGNNANILEMWAYNNPSLSCIQVDAAGNTPPAGQDWKKDATATYSDNCAALAVNDLTALGCVIYPNPVTNTMYLKAETLIDKVTIYSMLGQEVLKVSPDANQTEIDISQLATATYIVKITIGQKTGSYHLIKK